MNDVSINLTRTIRLAQIAWLAGILITALGALSRSAPVAMIGLAGLKVALAVVVVQRSALRWQSAVLPGLALALLIIADMSNRYASWFARELASRSVAEESAGALMGLLLLLMASSVLISQRRWALVPWVPIGFFVGVFATISRFFVDRSLRYEVFDPMGQLGMMVYAASILLIGFGGYRGLLASGGLPSDASRLPEPGGEP